MLEQFRQSIRVSRIIIIHILFVRAQSTLHIFLSWAKRFSASFSLYILFIIINFLL